MRYKFTTEEYKKIEELVECAIIAPNKAAAKKYSGQLNYIGSDVTGCSRNVYSELTAAVVSASGAIHDKDRYVDIAYQQLLKFRTFCVE